MLSLALSGQQQRERLHEQQVLVRLRNLGVFSTRNIYLSILRRLRSSPGGPHGGAARIRRTSHVRALDFN